MPRTPVLYCPPVTRRSLCPCHWPSLHKKWVTSAVAHSGFALTSRAFAKRGLNASRSGSHRGCPYQQGVQATTATASLPRKFLRNMADSDHDSNEGFCTPANERLSLPLRNVLCRNGQVHKAKAPIHEKGYSCYILHSTSSNLFVVSTLSGYPK